MHLPVLKTSLAKTSLAAATALLALAVAPVAANVGFTITNNDNAGEGFNDPTLGAQRLAALQFAAGIWSAELGNSYVGETIKIDATFDALGGTTTAATLGQAGATDFTTNGGAASPYNGNSFFARPLANHLRATDTNGATSEITAQFNSDVDNATVLGPTNFYYGTNGAPGSDVDFVSVALHEIGHGLGLTNFVKQDGSFNGSLPSVYDRFLARGSDGAALTSLSQSDRAALLISNDLVWNGPLGVLGNGGVKPKLYSPNPYQPGSTASHLDEATFPNELMSPIYSGVDHTPGSITNGMLADMGWTIVAAPEPTTLAAVAFASCATLARRRRR